MKEFGLTDEGWTFRFSHKKTIIGTCYHGEKVIEFSKWYVESHPDEVEDTIRHEIAHALIDPSLPDHGREWRLMAIKCGARPERCYDSASPMVNSKAKYNYVLQCGNDDCPNTTQWKYHRLTKRARFGLCPNCHQRLTILDLKTGEIIGGQYV